MPISPRHRVLITSSAAAVLWMLFAGVRGFLSQVEGPAVQLAALLPAVVPPGLVWGATGTWTIVTIIIGGIAVGLLHATVSGALRPEAAPLIAAWFATVASGAMVGLCLDIASSWSALASFGPRGIFVGEVGVAAASGALWGLAVGWIPGLIARASAPAAAPREAPASSPRRVGWLVSAGAVAIIAVIGAGVATDSARTAAIEADVAAQREAEAADSFGAPADPDAQGVPVPDVADAEADLPPEWCTPEKAMLLSGEPDAASGHRAFPIRLMNFSDEPCMVEGYPDVAFGDQNQHLLAVTVEQGSSFMAQDAGPQRVEIPPGGTAIAILGWDAASPHGALVTTTVYAAATAGLPRGSWPLELDIVEGSTVAVTAWAVDPTG